MKQTESSIVRNSALDFTKGILVLFMLLYHWINYFVSTQGFIYTYLRFITPSFIFVAGFLISHVYPVKYGWGNPAASQRLVKRGFKLLLLFTILNVAANSIVVNNYNGTMPGVTGFVRNVGSIYLSGNARAAFWVLVPISYLLVLAAGILLAATAVKYAVHLICGTVFVCLALLNFYDRSSANLELVAIGLVGMVVGLYQIERINRWVDRPIILLGLYMCYVIAVTVWGGAYLLQIVGVCLSVMLIYLLGMKSVTWGGVQRPINLLGEYSLFGYITQIALLQLLFRIVPQFHLGAELVWAISFVGAFALTIMTVKILDWSREKSRALDVLYRVTFS